jgi:hypothetical protein
VEPGGEASLLTASTEVERGGRLEKPVNNLRMDGVDIPDQSVALNHTLIRAVRSQSGTEAAAARLWLVAVVLPFNNRYK